MYPLLCNPAVIGMCCVCGTRPLVLSAPPPPPAPPALPLPPPHVDPSTSLTSATVSPCTVRTTVRSSTQLAGVAHRAIHRRQPPPPPLRPPPPAAAGSQQHRQQQPPSSCNARAPLEASAGNTRVRAPHFLFHPLACRRRPPKVGAEAGECAPKTKRGCPTSS